jgi:hypothetical protein
MLALAIGSMIEGSTQASGFMTDQKATNDGFREWVDRHEDDDRPDLPLTHTAKAYYAETIIKSNEVSPQKCEVFNEALSYFFYGRPAYRVSSDKVVQYEASCPYCLIFSPELLKRAKKIFPFDTGAYDARMYKHVLIDEMDLADFSLERQGKRIAKLINATFNDRIEYFDGNRSAISNPDEAAEAWEMAARAYLKLIQSPGRNEPGDRICSVEVIFSDPVPLTNNLRAVVVPHTHWKDGSGAPWLQNLANEGIDIVPYIFVPGRHPEFYQTMMEAQVRKYYFDKNFLP